MNSACYTTNRSTASALALAVSVVCLLAFCSSFFVSGYNNSHGADANVHSATIDVKAPKTRQLVRRLLELMNERIALMHDVARWKYNNDVPVADLEREKAILVRVAEQKLPANLDAAFVVKFFHAQMDVAKLVQTELIQRWKEEKRKPFTDVPDLKTELRPQISQISKQITNILSQLAVDRPNRQLVNLVEYESQSLLVDDLLSASLHHQMIQPVIDLFSIYAVEGAARDEK